MKASQPKYIVTSVRFTPDEFKKLRFFAQAEDKSIAQIVRKAVSSYLDGTGGKSFHWRSSKTTLSSK